MLNSKINIGRLDRLLTFEEKVKTINGSNEELFTWQFLKKKWAAVIDKPGDETVQADKITFVNTTSFITRYDSQLSVENRILYNDLVYEIISITESQETRKGQFEIVAQQVEGELP